ncbi:hypothetical protein [Corynebacterium hesseae]
MLDLHAVRVGRHGLTEVLRLVGSILRRGCIQDGNLAVIAAGVVMGLTVVVATIVATIATIVATVGDDLDQAQTRDEQQPPRQVLLRAALVSIIVLAVALIRGVGRLVGVRGNRLVLVVDVLVLSDVVRVLRISTRSLSHSVLLF